MNRTGEAFHSLVAGRRRGLWPAFLRAGLSLASVPYGWAVGLRNGMFDRGWKRSHKVAVPVISVGNLTLGGTGKTPCVETVARFYRELDLRVAILSRGYGSADGCNDEALVLEENLPDVPHLQGADRVALANIAIEELESEVLVLDDGFQHRRLARNLDIVLLDATNPWGHDRMFPRGLLRESRAGIRRAGMVLLTRCDQASVDDRQELRESMSRLAPGVSLAETTHRPVDLRDHEGRTAPLERLLDRPIAAFCGLGNPEAFRRTLLDLGVQLADFQTYPDHHAYSRTDVENLRAWARQQASECIVVTTQKDLVKLRLPQLGGRDLFALRICLHFESGREAFDQQLSKAVLSP